MTSVSGSATLTASCNSWSHISPIRSLAFQKLNDITLLEDFRIDRQANLKPAIHKDGYLANPLIVTQHAGRHLLLDGHHRFECLRQMGLEYAPIQYIPLGNAGLQFGSWIHLARIDDPEELIAGLRSQSFDIERATVAEAQSMLESGKHACSLAFYETSGPQIFTIAPGAARLIDLLRSVTNAYTPKRVTELDLPPGSQFDPQLAFSANRSMNLLVRFAPIGLTDVFKLVAQGERIPVGITRTKVGSGRILGINVPLTLLSTAGQHRSRIEWLNDLRTRRPAFHFGPTVLAEQAGPRRYEEPVFVYDPALQPVNACLDSLSFTGVQNDARP